jgi:hypothetical protein
MLNYCYVVEAGRFAKALAAQGLALPIGYLHSDKKGRNSLVARFSQIDGYRCLSLMRASGVVKCQLALA